MDMQTEMNANSNTKLSDLCFKIGEHGVVKYVDHMGSDAAIADAARISYSSNKIGARSKENDRRLIRRLVRDHHTSPLEMVEIKLYIKLPIFVMRQLVRHRTASLNEVSARYSVLSDEMYLIEQDNIKPQSKTNKQGREDVAFENANLARSLIDSANQNAYSVYNQLLELDVSREIARGVLPVNIYTEVVWKQNLHNMLHLLRLRLDPHAQQEIREYAQAIYNICMAIAPVAVEAWTEYVKDARSFSKTELGVLMGILFEMNKHDDGKLIMEEISHIVGRMQKDGKFTANEAHDFKQKLLYAASHMIQV